MLTASDWALPHCGAEEAVSALSAPCESSDDTPAGTASSSDRIASSALETPGNAADAKSLGARTHGKQVSRLCSMKFDHVYTQLSSRMDQVRAWP